MRRYSLSLSLSFPSLFFFGGDTVVVIAVVIVCVSRCCSDGKQAQLAFRAAEVLRHKHTNTKQRRTNLYLLFLLSERNTNY